MLRQPAGSRGLLRSDSNLDFGHQASEKHVHDQTQNRQARAHHASATGQVDRGSHGSAATTRTDEQTSRFFNKIEDALAVPFVTRILGVEVSLVAVEMGEDGSSKPCVSMAAKSTNRLARFTAYPAITSWCTMVTAYGRWVQGVGFSLLALMPRMALVGSENLSRRMSRREKRPTDGSLELSWHDLVGNYFAGHAGHKGIKAARSQYDAWLDIVTTLNGVTRRMSSRPIQR